jgi:flagellar biosynthesis protein FlhA
LLAVPPSGLVSRPDGRDGVDPVTGQPAVWIHADGREVAELAGCRVLEASAVVAGHFGEVILDHADELMTHDQVRKLLDRARASSPALVDEVVPALLRTGEIQRILQNLVRERVGVRDLEMILEALAEHAVHTKDPDSLTECARRALGRRLIEPYLGPDGRLRAIVLDEPLDARLAAPAATTHTHFRPQLGRDTARELVRAIAMAVEPLLDAHAPPVVLCSAEARLPLKNLTRAELPRLVVLAQGDLPRDVPIEILGTVVEEPSPIRNPAAARPEAVLRE